MPAESRDHLYVMFISLMVLVFVLVIIAGIVCYKALHRPPTYYAVQASGQKLLLVPSTEPDLLPDTILQWAEKAATLAYTFDFVNYNNQIAAAKPYFTDAGWNDYLGAVKTLIDTIVKKQLFVNGVVSGAPVISNQGELSGLGYAWRVQIPFLVTYSTSGTTFKKNFYIVMTIVRVPTDVTPQGIGIEQFVMD